MNPEKKRNEIRVCTGVPGLDEILEGGIPENRVCLVHGGPGTGKTTLSLQFLLEGVRRKEKCLYITLLQNRDELMDVFASHEWNPEGLDILELPQSVYATAVEEQTLFRTEDVELYEATNVIIKGIEEIRPKRLVLDSASEMTMLVENPYQLRKQLLKIKKSAVDSGCTSLFITGDGVNDNVVELQTITHGSIGLYQEIPVYGYPKRSIVIKKMRGMQYRGGFQDFEIRTGGIHVYPRIVVPQTVRDVPSHKVSSGISTLDDLLGGGLSSGTSCLITGTTGAGKSTLASVFLDSAVKRGEKCSVYCFDESKNTFLQRARSMGMSFPDEMGKELRLYQINVGDISPGEMMNQIKEDVDNNNVSMVILDSLKGFVNAMPEQRLLIVQLHELIGYLSNANVLAIMVDNIFGLLGSNMQTEVDASYIADTVILMRHFEARGEMHRCISVIKKRYGDHERKIREFFTDNHGVRVGGKSLAGFSGILTGTPRYLGEQSSLINNASESPERSNS